MLGFFCDVFVACLVHRELVPSLHSLKSTLFGSISPCAVMPVKYHSHVNKTQKAGGCQENSYIICIFVYARR